jgi:hypothetical protein
VQNLKRLLFPPYGWLVAVWHRPMQHTASR